MEIEGGGGGGEESAKPSGHPISLGRWAFSRSSRNVWHFVFLFLFSNILINNNNNM